MDRKTDDSAHWGGSEGIAADRLAAGSRAERVPDLDGGGILDEFDRSVQLHQVRAARVERVGSDERVGVPECRIHNADRDLKPANILIDERGEPHVADFGLGKRVENEVDLTHSGALLGTPTYMSPEQAGPRGALTTSTDVYGLGTILYALLSGRAPFAGSSLIEVLDKVRGELPDPPSKHNPLPAALAASLALSVVAGLAGVGWKWREADRERTTGSDNHWNRKSG
jgi:hypothetical protein